MRWKGSKRRGDEPPPSRRWRFFDAYPRVPAGLYQMQYHSPCRSSRTSGASSWSPVPYRTSVCWMHTSQVTSPAYRKVPCFTTRPSLNIAYSLFGSVLRGFSCRVAGRCGAGVHIAQQLESAFEKDSLSLGLQPKGTDRSQTLSAFLCLSRHQ